MHQVLGNPLSQTELKQIEETAHRFQTCDATIGLRLATALRDALQEIHRNKADGRTASSEYFLPEVAYCAGFGGAQGG